MRIILKQKKTFFLLQNMFLTKSVLSGGSKRHLKQRLHQARRGDLPRVRPHYVQYDHYPREQSPVADLAHGGQVHQLVVRRIAAAARAATAAGPGE